MDVIQGGEKKLAKALCQLIDLHRPKAAFVYSTCIVGVIGDDVEAVCKQVAAIKGIPVLPVHSEGFRGTKRDGYRAACEALLKLVGRDRPKASARSASTSSAISTSPAKCASSAITSRRWGSRW